MSVESQLAATGPLKVQVLAMLTRLRQLACSLSLVMNDWNKQSSKLVAWFDLLQEINLSQNHVLVFSQFTSFLDEAEAILDITKGTIEERIMDLQQRNRDISEFLFDKGNSAASLTVDDIMELLSEYK